MYRKFSRFWRNQNILNSRIKMCIHAWYNDGFSKAIKNVIFFHVGRYKFAVRQIFVFKRCLLQRSHVQSRLQIHLFRTNSLMRNGTIYNGVITLQKSVSPHWLGVNLKCLLHCGSNNIKFCMKMLFHLNVRTGKSISTISERKRRGCVDSAERNGETITTKFSLTGVPFKK